MKRQKEKIVLIILIILILCIFLFQNGKKFNNKFQDELIFFKMFFFKQKKDSENILKSENQGSQEHQQYRFQVSYKNIDFRNVYLSNTINKDTLIREKIAPGTKGAFEIVLESNKKTHYQIKFESKNKKPENLTFKIEGKDKKYQELEEMEQELKGEVKENKRIIIHWEWEYETNEILNVQDTKDGEMIKQYNFTIYAIGE